MASWDTSGDPCPTTNYQWSITRLDGNVTQEYLDMRTKTSGENDELKMENGETYYSLVKVTNAIGYQYIIRSDGVTIKDTALLPGKVYDGDVAGFDLDYLPTKTSASANWNGFGLPPEAIIQVDVETGNPGIQINQSYIDQQDDSQVISFYEVALGSDRRFDETRTNVMPFINVGLNMSVAFYDLVDVTLRTALYYFTVRATSKSFATAEVSSNGFYMGFDKGVGANEIKVGPCISSTSDMDVIWEDYSTDLTMLLYYVAVSNNTDANGTDCKLYVDGGRASDAQRAQLFTEMSVTNNGLDTFMEIRGLKLEQNKEYYVYVIGTDKTGQCAMNVTQILVDITAPETGRVKAGPYYDMPLTYAVDNTSLVIDWEDFQDLESGIANVELSLWSNTSCKEDSVEEIEVNWISVSTNISTYTMVDLNMTYEKPYTVKLRVTNCAGLESVVATNPIVFDSSTPTAGRVVDGLDFTNDGLWFNDRTTVSGSILHLPSPTSVACPPRPTSMTNATGWNVVDSFGFKDPDGIFWKILHDPDNVRMNYETEEVEIKIYHDISSERIVSGAYYRSADMDSAGGVYEVQIKCANGSGNAVTGVMFWDGPESAISPYNYQRDIEFPNCECCLRLPVLDTCEGCNCTAYRIDNNISVDTLTTEAAPTPAPTTPAPLPYDVIDDKGRSVVKGNKYIARTSCGLQIIAATAEYNISRVIAWCRTFNDTYDILKTETQLDFDPTSALHTYKMVFFSELEDPTARTRCFQVYVDGEYLTEVCGIPELSSDTKLFFHVYNKDNYMPDTDDAFNVWTTRATFANLVLPPTPGLPCRSGDPFRGGTNGIVQYDVGIGRSKLSTEIVPFRKVLEPCLPCFYTCSRLNCDPSCAADVTEKKTFTLTGIDLPPKEPYTNSTHTWDVVITYYLTVKATLGSGATVTASSDGFYVDDTPPEFDLDIMKGDFYIDVNQGPLTPVRFSSSNSTIKAFWRCEDKESDIIEYLWAIGTTPGGEEMQPFTSTGTTASGINSSFEGILTHESKFYVSVICKNGANKESKYVDTVGLTILLESPNTTDVNTTVEGSEDFPEPVSPADAKIGSDPTSIGFFFTILPDPTIDRYDMCLGSDEGLDDIFPCTWVGYNTSGEVKIMNGSLYLNGEVLSRLSEVKAFDQNQTDDERAAPQNNVFRMEPGRTVFITCRVCSVAMLCTKKNLGSLTMASKGATFKKSQGGEAIDVVVEMETRTGRRKRRGAPTIELVTPEELSEGQSLLIEPLSEEEMDTNYGSASSTNFQPYIVNPNTTMDMTERLLYKRIKDYSYSFTVVPVGHLPMPGPLSVSYNDPVGPIQKGLRNMLLHWNPKQPYWEITSRLCTSVEASQREVWVNETDTMTVQVCNTWRDPNGGQSSSSRQRRVAVSSDYYHSETQFIVATVDAEVYNSPPELNVSAYVTMQEDQGTLTYQLSAVDEEGDQTYYRLVSSSATGLGTANVTESGLFTFTPCSGCSGNVTVNIEIYEQQTDPDIPPASSIATIYVNITEVNDPPVAFLAKDGVYMLENDVTEPVALLVEQMADIYWLIGAYDQEGDQISMFIEHPTLGNITIQSNTTSVPNFTHCANTSLITGDRTTLMPCDPRFTTFPLPEEQMSWLTVSFSYMSETYGNDTFKIFFKDSRNALSYTVTIKLLVASAACIREGNCDNMIKGKTPVSFFPQPYAGSSDLAMDGDDSTCFITYKNKVSKLVIDMERRQAVDGVGLVFRPQHAYRFTPFTLYLSNTANYEDGTKCYEYTDQSKLPKEADAYSCVGSGQYVIMRVDRSGVIPPNWRPDDPYASMSLCEISVSSPSGGGINVRTNLAEGIEPQSVSVPRYIGSPALITDGDVNTCFITYSTKEAAELVLNLGSSKAVKQVGIAFRAFHSYRLAPFWLYLSNTPTYTDGTLCYQWTDTTTIPGQDAKYSCVGTAQYVILLVDRSGTLPSAWRPDDPRTSMSLCEFQVLNY